MFQLWCQAFQLYHKMVHIQMPTVYGLWQLDPPNNVNLYPVSSRFFSWPDILHFDGNRELMLIRRGEYALHEPKLSWIRIYELLIAPILAMKLQMFCTVCRIQVDFSSLICRQSWCKHSTSGLRYREGSFWSSFVLTETARTPSCVVAVLSGIFGSLL